MNRAIEFFVGLLFGWGLLLSGMTDPGKVQGFLDLAGPWDPSLAFVMGGAIGVGVFAFALAKRRTKTFLGGAFHLPTSRDIDRRLVIGALLFGAGWGLAGFCPGPGIVGPWRRVKQRPLRLCWPCWPACSSTGSRTGPLLPRQRRSRAADPRRQCSSTDSTEGGASSLPTIARA